MVEKKGATLAQLVEHVIRNDGVRSSILRGGSTDKIPRGLPRGILLYSRDDRA